MAVKIKLTRLGKIRNPQYRIAIADARNRRDGRSIEVIGRYHPKEDPSLIEINSERAQYWLSVGAQPTEPVLKLLKITGDWQKFKGLPGTEGTLQVKAPKPSKLELFNAALAAADGAPTGEASQPRRPRRPRMMTQRPLRRPRLPSRHPLPRRPRPSPKKLRPLRLSRLRRLLSRPPSPPKNECGRSRRRRASGSRHRRQSR